MADWIIVVDDDIITLKSAGHILSKNRMRVTAFQSGKAMLEYLQSGELPDLILMDIIMPGMDGFETLRQFRELEAGRKETPVIFLTGENDRNVEVKGFREGAMDFLRKPFVPEVLIERVQRVLRTQEKMHHYEKAAAFDKMTGMLNKEAAEIRLKALCSSESGFLCVLDLDSFKPVNDLFGHDMGDRVLALFSRVLKEELRHDDLCGRIGGDEFIAFVRNMKTDNELHQLVARVNHTFQEETARLVGSQLPLGVSAGAAAVPEHGQEYERLFQIADRALYEAKQSGRHGLRIAPRREAGRDKRAGELSLDAVTSVLEERSVSSSAMWMGTEAFISIYQYMTRYMERYHGIAFRTLFTLRMNREGCGDEERSKVMAEFRRMMQESLRNSDVMAEVSDNQLFLLLPETQDYNIDQVVARLLGKWQASPYGRLATVTCETGQVHLNRGTETDLKTAPDRVVVVDDDVINLKIAERVLTRENIEVTSLGSGRELLGFLQENKPDLILLDVKMPEMDGFETLEKIKNGAMAYKDIPVIFLTADDSQETEIRGLKLGAIDFIRKPFVPEVLTMRVRNIIELTRLQYHLTQEVAKKSTENSMLFIHVVRALAEAIDAKDTYTHGHSSRVARYAREIAERYGYSDEAVSDVYMMGLVHDVGKIGVPDAVINKPGRLTEEEYAQIKVHPVMGAKILEAIQEMPSLSIGARWHHERFDGNGYPDGLIGTDIPEEARIIAVADAYDAMTSQRSYRDALPQEAVRAEIEKGSGSQFDPRFARIMLDIIDEDREYSLRERGLPE